MQNHAPSSPSSEGSGIESHVPTGPPSEESDTERHIQSNGFVLGSRDFELRRALRRHILFPSKLFRSAEIAQDSTPKTVQENTTQADPETTSQAEPENTPLHLEHVFLRDMIATLAQNGHKNILRDAESEVCLRYGRVTGSCVHRLIEYPEEAHRQTVQDMQARDVEYSDGPSLTSISENGTQEPPSPDYSEDSQSVQPPRPFPQVPTTWTYDRCGGLHLEGMSCRPA